MRVYLIIAALAYLLGSIPFGYIIVRISRGEDIRRSGSGNIGATNVARSVAPALGLLTLFLDAAKGFLAVTLALIINRSAGAGGPANDPAKVAACAALLAICAHMFPVWLRFRGGKGVATGVGAFLALAPKAVLIALGIFVAVVTIFRYVSLASIAAAAGFPVAAYLVAGGLPALSAWAMVAASLLIIIRHHENIKRLMAGTEAKFSLKKA